MKILRLIRTTLRIVAVVSAQMALAQLAHTQPARTQLAPTQPAAKITIRAVSAPVATSPLVGNVDQLREIANGKVLVNDGKNRALVLFDGMLQNPTALADTMGSVTAYPRFGKLIAYTADSSLFYETDSRTLIVVSPQGKFGQVLALPRPQDFNFISNSGLVTTDGHGHLIYQGQRPSGPRSMCNATSAPPAQIDSVSIFLADFEKRTVDTVGRAKTTFFSAFAPITKYDANCKVLSAKLRVNPSIQPTDSWTVTSRGTIAIVRSHDYHIDWINPDGTKRTTPKMAFDWRRLTDADKQRKIDSARKIIDSVSALGGYRMTSCDGGRSTMFQTSPPAAPSGGAPGGSGNGRGSGGGGGGASVSVSGAGSASGEPGPNNCQIVAVTAEYVPLDSMADYIAPIRDNAALADLDGNVWILPSTSASAIGGLLYDVVNTEGVVFERVQLPGGRVIAGFGKSGVLYLSKGDYRNGYAIEKVKVVR